MTIDELQEASMLLSSLRRIEEHHEAVKGRGVIGVTIGLTDRQHGNEPITLERGKSGCGTISGIGFPPELEGALTTAFFGYFNEAADKIKRRLKELGVKEVRDAA